MLFDERIRLAIVVLMVPSAPSTEVDEVTRLLEVFFSVVRFVLVVAIAASTLLEELERLFEAACRVVMAEALAASSASTETDDVDIFARDVFCAPIAVSVLFDEAIRFAIEVLYAAAIAASTLEEEFERFRELACSVVMVEASPAR